MFGCRLGSGASFARSGDLGVKQVLGEIPDVLPGRGEAKILAREVAKTEIICDPVF